MVDYVYKVRVWTDTTDVIGVDPAQEAADTADFEANYKASTYAVDGLEILATAFVSQWSYSTLKAKVDGVSLAWSDVKLVSGENYYDMIVLSATAL